MPITVWTQPSGYDFGTFNERSTVNIPLPIEDLPLNVFFKLISGKLPAGLRLEGRSIIGTPFEVPRTTQYKFVIRSIDGYDISDRTFTMTIEGPDEPKWLTPAGILPIGTNNAFYIIDSSFIDFNLSAIDNDTAAGQTLNYFIASGEGELPPGLILLPNGRITGFIQPVLATPTKGDNGFYDTGLYDSSGYDFGYRPSNGFDTFIYDLFTYDFSIDTLSPKKLNRNYEFIATITDGDTVTKRRFRIYVVGDDFFRADNVIMKAGEGAYTADVTYVRSPIFTTPKYLGLRRANNYQTFKIDIFEGFYDELGPVVYELCPANAEITGLVIKDQAGDNRKGSTVIRFIKSTGIPQVGQVTNFNLDFFGATNKTYTIVSVDPLGSDFYRITLDQPLDETIPNNTPIYIGSESRLPPGMEFDSTTGEIFGIIPYRPAVTEEFFFTVKAVRFGKVLNFVEEVVNGKLQRTGSGFETASSRRMFNVDILGEVESAINWISPNSLGTIDVGYPSILSVEAKTTFRNSLVLYTLEKGDLPPGLSLNLDGEIVGKVNQLRDQNTYRSYWKPNTTYKKRDIVKQDNFKNIKSVIRRKNISSLVLNENHEFKNNEILKINSSIINFNYVNGIEILLDKTKINSVLDVEQTGSKYQVKVSIPEQNLEPLSPVFTSITGISAFTGETIWDEVSATSTTGNGIGATFKIHKGANSTARYNVRPIDPITNEILPIITLINPGSGYLPGDKITISGSALGGVDGVNDLTFLLYTGTDFKFKINGNSNSKFNGEFYSSASTKDTITLIFDEDPGNFGVGLISTTIDVGLYEAQTQIVPLNYFSYYNSGTNKNMTSATGQVSGNPLYYISTTNHPSVSTFSTTGWKKYEFPGAEKTPTSFDLGLTYIDDDDTSIDRVFTFTVKARDQLNYSAVAKEFNIRINIPNSTYYSNISARPFMKQSQRDLFKNFINDITIFNPRYMYRLNDSNFGLKKDLSTLIFAGIETKEAVKYISAMGLNHKPKRFKLGNVKKAIAKSELTGDIVYEVVYIDLIDPLEKGKKHLPFKVAHRPSTFNLTADNNNQFYNGPFDLDFPAWNRPNPFNATIDRTDVIAGDSGTGVKFPSSISIWRKRIRQIEDARRERNFLPLWMRTIQPGSYTELDYIPAVVLCYCKPGTADEILLNIKNSNFDFKLLDYTIDRYIIDAVEGYYEDKYLVFRNDRTTIA